MCPFPAFLALLLPVGTLYSSPDVPLPFLPRRLCARTPFLSLWSYVRALCYDSAFTFLHCSSYHSSYRGRLACPFPCSQGPGGRAAVSFIGSPSSTVLGCVRAPPGMQRAFIEVADSFLFCLSVSGILDASIQLSYVCVKHELKCNYSRQCGLRAE